MIDMQAQVRQAERCEDEGIHPEAMSMARRLGVDLVLQNSATDPPLCRLIEWSKYKYEIEKRTRLARQKQRAAR